MKKVHNFNINGLYKAKNDCITQGKTNESEAFSSNSEGRAGRDFSEGKRASPEA